MKKIFLVTGLLSLASASLFGMDQKMTYRVANSNDLGPIVDLFKAARESKNLFVLPNTLLPGSVESNIEKKRMFVALKDNDEYVSMRKLYLPTGKNKQGILRDEFRLVGPRSEPAQEVPVFWI